MAAPKKKYIVPDELKGNVVWTTPPKFDRKTEIQGRFEIDKCTDKELEYLSTKNLGIVAE